MKKTQAPAPLPVNNTGGGKSLTTSSNSNLPQTLTCKAISSSIEN